MAKPRSLLRGSLCSSQLLQAALGRPQQAAWLAARRHANRRWVQISTFEGSTTQPDNLPINASSADAEGPDAKFEVLGAPYSLLSASLSASQTLYTRRGTLVGLSGKAESVISTLSTLEPFRRALLGIPFFYQKVTSATPVTALISTKSPLTSFTVVHLDGTIDWMVAQREAILAWTGQTLSITPTVNYQLTIGYWGQSRLGGRGLVGLVGNGQIYELVLGTGESYIAHPSNVVAYTISKQAPIPYRFRSSTLKLEVPGASAVSQWLPDVRFFREVQRTETWRAVENFVRWLRTTTRRTLFGDGLYLQFQGPATILLQTRAARVSDVLTAREINEIAETPAGRVEDAIRLDVKREKEDAERDGQRRTAPLPTPTPNAASSASTLKMATATVGRDGKVRFDEQTSGSSSGSG